jgi:hypothetical protein
MYGVRIQESLEQQQYNANWRQQYEKEQERARQVAIERIRTGTATQANIDQIRRDSMPGGALDPAKLDAERRVAQQQADFEAKNAKRAQEQAAAAAAAEERRLTAERQMSRNDRLKAAADAAAAAAAAEVQKAAANSLPNLIANAVATGKCDAPNLVNTAIFQSAQCQSYRGVKSDKNRADIIAVNKKANDEASKKLTDALNNRKSAVEKVKKSPAKLKAKEKAKKAFAKGIAKIKKQNRRR